RAASRTTIRRQRCWRATAAARSRKCFSTWRAAAPKPARRVKPARRRNDRASTFLRRVLAAPGRRHGAALLVSVALVVAAHARTDLLAGGADADVGLPAALHLHQCGIFRPRWRHVHRRGAVVGHSVPRPARLLDLV